jgi:hypothetical protein
MCAYQTCCIPPSLWLVCADGSDHLSVTIEYYMFSMLATWDVGILGIVLFICDSLALI